MRLQITMDQNTDIMVFGEDDPPFGYSFSKQSLIARIRPSLAEIDDVMADSPHRSYGRRHNVGISKEPHLFGGDLQTFRSRCFTQACGVQQTGVDICRLEHRIRF